MIEREIEDSVVHPPDPDLGWVPELVHGIDELGQLLPGWNSYDAEAPSSLAIFNAKQVVADCWSASCKPTKLLPSAEGGIGIAFESRERYADIECFNTGEILAVTSTRNGEPEVWTLNVNSIAPTVEKIRGFLAQ